MTELKKIELTCQQLFDAGVEEINGGNFYKNAVIFSSISPSIFNITDLPDSGVAPKPVDKSEWIGKRCWFWNVWNDDYTDMDISVLEEIDDHDVIIHKHKSYNNNWYRNCKLATKEEVLEWFEKNGGIE